jgi:hypothetical protein
MRKHRPLSLLLILSNDAVQENKSFFTWYKLLVYWEPTSVLVCLISAI